MDLDKENIKEKTNWLKSLLDIKFYLRKWIYHRRLAPLIGAPLFYFCYFIIPVFVFFLFLCLIGRIVIGINIKDLFVKYFDFWIAVKIAGTTIFIYFVIFYLYLLRYPRSPKNKIGIGVAFAYDFMDLEKLKDALRYRDLILRELEKVLDQERMGDKFKIIKLNDYQANRLHKNFGNRIWAHKYVKKTRIIFTVFGYVKSEMYSGEKKYKYLLNYLVGHRLIPIKAAKQMSKKFTKQLRKQKWIFNESNTGRMSEGVAENIRESAYFALGLSSFYSKNPFIAIFFLKKLLTPNTRRPDLIIEIKKHLAFSYFYIGKIIAKNKIGENWIKDAITNVGQSIEYKVDYYDSYLLLCYLYYKRKQIDKSFEAINNAEKYQKNAIWRFSKAFLYFYQGDKESIQHGLNMYRSLKKKRLTPIKKEVYLDEIIPSLLEVIIEEQKNQFYYSLIFVYYKALDNKEKAREYYNLFLEKEKDNPLLSDLISGAEKILS